jgi:uncharacterized protein (AIM24 family)
MTTAQTTYTCPYCRSRSDGSDSTCPNCGAPVDVVRRTTSGWTEMPALPDMTRVQMAGSTLQVVGRLAPAAEVRLAAGEGMVFPHYSLLWRDDAMALDTLELRDGWDRIRGGLPVTMLRATGPGTVTFTSGVPGELLVVPLEAGAAIDVREHQTVAATAGLSFDWYDSGVWFMTRGDPDAGSQQGGAGLLRMAGDLAGIDVGGSRREGRDETAYHWPVGRQVDRWTAGDRPGAVLVRAGGNVFLRDLAEGETILVKPPALLYKDPTVAWQMHVEFPHAGMKFWRSWGNRYLWLRLWGPGRIALQSSYDRLEDPGTDFADSCQFTQRVW